MGGRALTCSFCQHFKVIDDGRKSINMQFLSTFQSQRCGTLCLDQVLLMSCMHCY
ncbi:hypothetical protein AAZX31_15G199300 [Glycine max]